MLKGMLFREQKNWEQSVQHFEKSLQDTKIPERAKMVRLARAIR
jgi:hypothetical protein